MWSADNFTQYKALRQLIRELSGSVKKKKTKKNKTRTNCTLGISIKGFSAFLKKCLGIHMYPDQGLHFSRAVGKKKKKKKKDFFLYFS